MLANIKLLLAILVLMFPISLQAQTATRPDEHTLQIFVRESCPHCADAVVMLLLGLILLLRPDLLL